MAYEVTWHGHATLSVNLDGTKIVVDPFLKGNSPVAQVSAEEIEADYIWLTHGHGDHVADALSIAQRCNAKIIANYEIVSWYAAQGYENAHPQHLGGGYTHPFGYLKMTPALHGSQLPDGSYGGMPGGFVLEGDKNIYISGDTALFSDMELIGEVGLDLAIVCVGDNFTMGPSDSIRAIQYLKPKQVIPYHYNTFDLIEVDIENWADRVRKETTSEPVVLDIEGKIEL